MPNALHHVDGLVRAAGALNAASLLMRRALKLGTPVMVHVDGIGDVEVRPRNSDLFVLSQIFGWEEYALDEDRLADLKGTAKKWREEGLTPLIIDAGANVGYSSLYLSRLFPSELVLAIEPDPQCFKILGRHVRNHPLIRPVNVALWSHNRGLNLISSSNGAWAGRVAEGVGTPSERLDALTETVPNSRVLLIKMDVEGAEREVIEACPDVFAQAKCIMIEPHDFCAPKSACLSPLFKIAASNNYDTILNGENIMLFAFEDSELPLSV